MMNNLTIEKLMQLKMPGMAAEFERQLATPSASDVPFEHRIRSLVDHELTLRDNRRLQLLLRKAALPQNASLENVDYRTVRGLDKSLFLSLGTLDWIRHHNNLVITGPTGTGKSWLACALAQQACREGLACHFIRVPDLIESFVVARGTASFVNRIRLLGKYDLLILDDWGIDSFNKRAQSDLLELIEHRFESSSVLITSQIPMTSWHATFDNKTVADALMDRIVHSSYQIQLSGESMRKSKAPGGKRSKREEKD
ncbi:MULTISPECIES: IS21-like element helper ATPase IstB [unclassified Herbaspirillum]|uniref:IS21-like element helper ATPase IstB n=1 Tax=unclassified Herbaspirillum TaxID=2624150 RepID=UPI00114F8A8B|nr:MULTISPECIES: IS21-like element helper ATPase IstB [unclassified Herbaspirillum]MBB5393048.1 DNA replication protein DnaC [Herbaspirillum sp. SJZ102]